MKTPYKNLSPNFKSSVHHLKGNNVISKYFHLNHRQKDSKAACKSLIHYKVVGGVIVVSDSDDDDEKDNNSSNIQESRNETLKPRSCNMVAGNFESNALSRTGSTNNHLHAPFQNHSCSCNSTTVHSQQICASDREKSSSALVSSLENRNVFTALNSFMNTSYKGRENFNKAMKSYSNSNPKGHELKEQLPLKKPVFTHKHILLHPQKTLSIVGAKRKQTTLDDWPSPKKILKSVLNGHKISPLKDVSQFSLKGNCDYDATAKLESPIGLKQNIINKNDCTNNYQTNLKNSETTSSNGFEKEVTDSANPSKIVETIDLTLEDLSTLNSSQTTTKLVPKSNNANPHETTTTSMCNASIETKKTINGNILNDADDSFLMSVEQILDEKICVSPDDDDGDLPVFSDNVPALAFSDLQILKTEANENLEESDKNQVNEYDDLDESEIPCTPEGCSLLTTRQKLKLIEDKSAPLTPRCARKVQRRIDDSDEFLHEHEIAGNELVTRKLTFTVNRILRDKRENEELKSMEERLLADIKKGGFAKFLDDSGDEDVFDSNEKEMFCQFANLKRMITSREGFVGLNEGHKNIKIFSRKRVFSYYCSHSVIRIEASFPELSGIPVLSQLKYLKQNIKLVGKSLGWYNNDSTCRNTDYIDKTHKLIKWLLQVLSTNLDTALLTVAEAALSTVFNLIPFKYVVMTSFYDAFCNLGISKKFFIGVGFSEVKSSPCKKCRVKKPLSSHILTILPHVIRSFTSVLSKHPRALTNAHFRHYITAMCLLLTSGKGVIVLQRNILRSLQAVLPVARNSTEMRFAIAADLLALVTDLPSLHHISSLLLSNGDDGVMLSQCIIQSIFYKCFYDEQISREKHDSTKSNLQKPMKEIAEKLTISSIRQYLKKDGQKISNLAVYNMLISCVLLVQCHVGYGRISEHCKHDVESITDSFRSLHCSIKDNGFLYCTEAKHFIRIAIAILEFQLQKLPKVHIHQQGIFKYLRTSKVSEEVVEDDATNSLDAEDHITIEDHLDGVSELPRMLTDAIHDEDPPSTFQLPEASQKNSLCLLTQDDVIAPQSDSTLDNADVSAPPQQSIEPPVLAREAAEETSPNTSEISSITIDLSPTATGTRPTSSSHSSVVAATCVNTLVTDSAVNNDPPGRPDVYKGVCVTSNVGENDGLRPLDPICSSETKIKDCITRKIKMLNSTNSSNCAKKLLDSTQATSTDFGFPTILKSEETDERHVVVNCVNGCEATLSNQTDVKKNNSSTCVEKGSLNPTVHFSDVSSGARYSLFSQRKSFMLVGKHLNETMLH